MLASGLGGHPNLAYSGPETHHRFRELSPSEPPFRRGCRLRLQDAQFLHDLRAAQAVEERTDSERTTLSRRSRGADRRRDLAEALGGDHERVLRQLLVVLAVARSRPVEDVVETGRGLVALHETG